jgi:hypothetical protein
VNIRRVLTLALVVFAALVVFLWLRGGGQSKPKGMEDVGASLPAPGEAAPGPDATTGPSLRRRTVSPDRDDAVASIGPAVVHGVVRRDGRAAPRALVAVIGTDSQGFARPPLATTTADAAGRYRLALPGWPSEMRETGVRAWSGDRTQASFLAAFGAHAPSADASREIDLDLWPTGAIEVIVTDEAGNALPDAQVEVEHATPREGSGPKPVARASDGAFRLEGLLGIIGVAAHAPGYQHVTGPVTVQPGSAPRTVRRRLHPVDSRRRITITDPDGRPLPGVPVVTDSRRRDRPEVSDERGEVVLSFAGAGSVRVDPESLRYVPLSWDGEELAAGTSVPVPGAEGREVSHVLTVARAAQVAGTVTMVSGAPAGPGVAVRMDGSPTVFTDAQGRFRFPVPVLPGPKTIAVAGREITTLLEEGPNEVRIEVADAVRLVVRLLDARSEPLLSGRPFAGTTRPLKGGVRLGEERRVPLEMEADGAWVAWVPPMTEGEYVVEVDAPAGVAAPALVVRGPLRAGETARRDLVVREPWFGSVRGRLVAADTGFPLASGSVTLTRDGGESLWVFLAESERLRVPVLAPGPWRVQFLVTGCAPFETRVDVRAGEGVDLGDVAFSAAPGK